MTYIELSERRDEFLPEIWTICAIGTTILLLRFAIRLRTVGIRGLQWDDFFALVTLTTLIMGSAAVHVTYYSGTNIEGTVLVYVYNKVLTPPELEQLIEGSKIEMIAWYVYPTCVWSLKGTMVSFLLRMTAGISKRRTVQWIGYACLASYAAIILTVTFGCWPWSNNYQIMPNPGLTCTLKTQNFIVMTILNILTDAAILSVPLPMLWTLQIPLKKKLAIGVLLSSGVFVITASITRITLTFAAAPSVLTVNLWGMREALVGIIAVNAPVLRPLFTDKFWTKGTYKSTSDSRGALTGHTGTGAGGVRSQAPHGPYELAPSVTSHTDGKHHHQQQRSNSFTGSEESIINNAAGSGRNPGVDTKTKGVVVHTSYEVSSEAQRVSASPPWDQAGFHKATAYGERSPV